MGSKNTAQVGKWCAKFFAKPMLLSPDHLGNHHNHHNHYSRHSRRR
jgi:hypothetical protein